ncbi:MAG: hypothetical protein JW850_05160 [Thermoflexales bacterium]|nr:hypothetical protein [Thermoflexales bacterium]
MTPPKVVIYGRSLFLAGVEASLAGRAELAVSSLDSAQASSLDTLLRLGPDAIILDASSPAGLTEMKGLFHNRRTPLLISLDRDTSQATVWRGRQQPVRRADDLVALIQSAHQHPGLEHVT